MHSSSGGILSVTALKILKDEGIVYGVSMAEDCYVTELIKITEEKIS